MNILLVDDDIVNQKIASQLLTKWGMDVTIAQDGLEALDVIKQKTFNLVLMDLNMPVMDGCEATTQIRSNEDPYFKMVPILAYTASSEADTKEKAEKLGMNDFVRKPLDAPEMHCKINQYILPKTTDARALKINFDLYADSDQHFQAELVSLMISNLRELQHGSYKSYYTGDTRHFSGIVHKVRSTTILLDDIEFNDVIDALKDAFLSTSKPAVLQENINHFNRFSESIIKGLQQELTTLTAGT